MKTRTKTLDNKRDKNIQEEIGQIVKTNYQRNDQQNDN